MRCPTWPEELAQKIEQKQQELTSILQQEKTKVKNVVVTEEEFKAMLEAPHFKKQVIDSVKFYDTRVKLTCTLGNDTVLYDYILPTSEYPIIPICYQWVGTPYPVSAVSPLVGKHQEINKAHLFTGNVEPPTILTSNLADA